MRPPTNARNEVVVLSPTFVKEKGAAAAAAAAVAWV
jgi:hypothetical protein